MGGKKNHSWVQLCLNYRILYRASSGKAYSLLKMDKGDQILFADGRRRESYADIALASKGYTERSPMEYKECGII